MPRSITKREYLRQLDKLAGRIEKEFLDAVRRRIQRASVKELEAAIAAGDLSKLVDEAGLLRSSLTNVINLTTSGYALGAASIANQLKQEFDILDPKVQQWLAQASSDLVRHITGDQLESIRSVVSQGYTVGQNPRKTALDIIGRVSKHTGRRKGGIVGLSSSQTGYVVNARAELGSLDPRYFSRTRRDKRFDAAIRKAIQQNKPLSDSLIQRVVGRYADRLLQLRGEAIARTESIRAIAGGRYAAVQQTITEGHVDPQDVVMVWSATMDNRTRHSHRTMNGQERAYNEPFEDGDGNLLRYPCDPEAPEETSINCRCMVQARVDFVGAQKRRERDATIS